MAKEKKDKKSGSIDDVMDKIQGEHSKDIETAFKLYDKHNKDENQDNLYNNIFAPGTTQLYEKFNKELDNTFKDDTAKIFNKKKELKKAAVKGIKAYFEKVQPNMLKTALDGIEDIEDQYSLLIGLYEHHQGINDQNRGYLKQQGYVSLRDLIEEEVKDKDTKVGKIKRKMYELKGMHAGQGLNSLNQQVTNRYFAGYHHIDIGEHVKKKWGLKIGEHVEYKQQGLADLLGLHSSLRDGEKLDYKKHGLKYVKPEKKYKKAA